MQDLAKDHVYHFTKRGFLRVKEAFRTHVLNEFGGKPITYLEIGVFEGQSLSWMLGHVLTHPESRAVGIDPWLPTLKLSDMESVMERAFSNLHPWMYNLDNSALLKCTLVRANSGEILRRMLRDDKYLADRQLRHYGIRPGILDLAFIDGAHHALGFLDDARLVLQLLRKGGWMLIDDVEGQGRNDRTDHVKQGLEMFLAESGNQVELLFKYRYMEAYKKI